MPELEAVRIVADWLESGANGKGGVPGGAGSVNDLLPAVPRDVEDGVPPAVTLYDSTRYAWVARLAMPHDGLAVQFPALVVYMPAELQLDGEIGSVVRDGMVDIAVMYVTKASETAASLAAGLYTTRAIIRSLGVLNSNAQAAARSRNGVSLTSCEQIRQVRGGASEAGLVLSTGVVAKYHVRDTAP